MPLVYGFNPGKVWDQAIGSLGPSGGAAPANAGEPAARPVGEKVRVDHTLTQGRLVAAIGAEKSPARVRGDGWRRPPRLGVLSARGRTPRTRCCTVRS
jgi:hypothetical protein